MATTAVLNLGVNSSQFNKGMAQASAKTKKFEKTASRLGPIIGAVFVAGMARAGWSMINMASDAEETESKLNAVFKGIEKESTIVADSIANKFGLANSTVQEMLGNTGDLLTGFGFARGEALKMSANVAELAVDLKSFQNFSGGAKGASEAITKALLGETESMKSLGVVVRQNTKGFRDQVASIQRQTGATEQQAKAQAIWMQIQEQTKNAQGDALKTYDSTANRIDRMSQGWKTTKEAIGSFLIEGLAVDDMVSALTDGMKALTNNTHNVRFAIEGATSSLKSFIAKARETASSFIGKSISGYKKAWAIITGDDAGLDALRQQSKIQEEVHKKRMKNIAETEKKADAESFKKWNETANRKKDISAKNAEEAIKTAIEKTKDDVAGVTATTGKSGAQRSEQFSGAFEKGSVEAYKIEKNGLGNKTERDNLKANKRTAEAVENASNTVVVNTF